MPGHWLLASGEGGGGGGAQNRQRKLYLYFADGVLPEMTVTIE